MKRLITTLILVLFAGTCFIGFAFANEKATKKECIDMCKKAGKMVVEIGIDAALEKLKDKNGPFVWKNSYVFCIRIKDGMNLAHPLKPGLIGKDLMGIKDINGKMFIAEFIEVANSEKGEGWVDYMWPKPGEKKPSPKTTFVYRVPGEKVAMCAGIYK